MTFIIILTSQMLMRMGLWKTLIIRKAHVLIHSYQLLVTLRCYLELMFVNYNYKLISLTLADGRRNCQGKHFYPSHPSTIHVFMSCNHRILTQQMHAASTKATRQLDFTKPLKILKMCLNQQNKLTRTLLNVSYRSRLIEMFSLRIAPTINKYK